MIYILIDHYVHAIETLVYDEIYPYLQPPFSCSLFKSLSNCLSFLFQGATLVRDRRPIFARITKYLNLFAKFMQILC